MIRYNYDLNRLSLCEYFKFEQTLKTLVGFVQCE